MIDDGMMIYMYFAEDDFCHFLFGEFLVWQSTETSQPADLPWVSWFLGINNHLFEAPIEAKKCLSLVVISCYIMLYHVISPFVGDLNSDGGLLWFTHGVTISFSVSTPSSSWGLTALGDVIEALSKAPNGNWRMENTSGSSSFSNWAESEKSENPFVEMFLPCFAHFSHEPSWLCFHQFCCQLLGRAQGSKNVPYRNHKLTMLMQAWRGRGVGPWMGAFHMSVGIILVGTKRVINYHSLTYQTCCGIWICWKLWKRQEIDYRKQPRRAFQPVNQCANVFSKELEMTCKVGVFDFVIFGYSSKWFAQNWIDRSISTTRLNSRLSHDHVHQTCQKSNLLATWSAPLWAQKLGGIGVTVEPESCQPFLVAFPTKQSRFRRPQNFGFSRKGFPFWTTLNWF